MDKEARKASLTGLYFFAVELFTIGMVLAAALGTNEGKKWVRLRRPECQQAWADMTHPGPHVVGHEAAVACCNHPLKASSWDAGICEAALTQSTRHLTSGLAFVLPLLTLVLNSLFSWSTHPPHVQKGQQRRLFLYIAVIAFRTLVLFKFLNFLQHTFQDEEHGECWYAEDRADRRCRNHFDFADHGVLFITQYMAVQTFESIAVLREYTSLLHLLVCMCSAGAMNIVALMGLYHTVSFFHSRVESIVAVALAVLFVQVPLLLIASGRLRSREWLRLRYYIAR